MSSKAQPTVNIYSKGVTTGIPAAAATRMKFVFKVALRMKITLAFLAALQMLKTISFSVNILVCKSTLFFEFEKYNALVNTLFSTL